MHLSTTLIFIAGGILHVITNMILYMLLYLFKGLKYE